MGIFFFYVCAPGNPYRLKETGVEAPGLKLLVTEYWYSARAERSLNHLVHLWGLSQYVEG